MNGFTLRSDSWRQKSRDQENIKKNNDVDKGITTKCEVNDKTDDKIKKGNRDTAGQ